MKQFSHPSQRRWTPSQNRLPERKISRIAFQPVSTGLLALRPRLSAVVRGPRRPRRNRSAVSPFQPEVCTL